jgi:hypothetical protein
MGKKIRGFGLTEVMLSTVLFTILAYYFSNWSIHFFKGLDNDSQKVNLSTANKMISQYLDCCATYKAYFGDSVYPGNIPLDDLMFTSGPVTLLDSGRNDLKKFIKPWQFRGVPGGIALNIEFGENIRSDKKYFGRDVSTLKSRDQFSGEQYNKKCQYNINHCGGSGGTSVSTSTSTSGTTGSTSSSPSSSSSSSGGTGFGGTSGTASSSSSSSSSSGGTGGSFPETTSNSSSSSGSTGGTSGSSSSSGGVTTSSSSGTGGSSGTSGSRGICEFAPTPCPACNRPGRQSCVTSNINITCLEATLCNQSIDIADNVPPYGDLGQDCNRAGCTAGLQTTCECQAVNRALCEADKMYAASMTCHQNAADLNCWLQCRDSLQQQAIACATCCAGTTYSQPNCGICPCP